MAAGPFKFTFSHLGFNADWVALALVPCESFQF